jgi:hypothetical protein
MTKVFFKRRIRIPMFGTWKWSLDDYKTPLVFKIEGGKAQIRLEVPLLTPREREAIFNANLSLTYENPSQRFLRGLRTDGKLAQESAKRIYGDYLDIYNKFEVILLSAGGVKNLLINAPMELTEFFENENLDSFNSRWSLDGKVFTNFNPKTATARRKIIPLFKSDQIITKKKWTQLQRAIDKEIFPSDEMRELLVIRTKLGWRHTKISTLEAAILIETILRDYTRKVLSAHGFSNNKIKSLNSELGFNISLNLVLPLSLTKAQHSKAMTHLQKIDLLRKTRNDVVHGNLAREDMIDEKIVSQGIDSGIWLIEMIRNKLGVI